jgi:serine protease Do
MRKKRGESRSRGGVAVENVDGAAARAGIRPGDVILVVQDTDVTDAKQFDGLVKGLDKTKPVRMLVRRGEGATWLLLRPAAR